MHVGAADLEAMPDVLRARVDITGVACAVLVFFTLLLVLVVQGLRAGRDMVAIDNELLLTVIIAIDDGIVSQCSVRTPDEPAATCASLPTSVGSVVLLAD